LSSQRTNTHRCRPQRGPTSGATTPAYLTGIGLVKLFVPPCALLTVPPVPTHTAEAVIVRFRGIRQDRPAPLLTQLNPPGSLAGPCTLHGLLRGFKSVAGQVPPRCVSASTTWDLPTHSGDPARAGRRKLRARAHRSQIGWLDVPSRGGVEWRHVPGRPARPALPGVAAGDRHLRPGDRCPVRAAAAATRSLPDEPRVDRHRDRGDRPRDGRRPAGPSLTRNPARYPLRAPPGVDGSPGWAARHESWPAGRGRDRRRSPPRCPPPGPGPYPTGR